VSRARTIGGVVVELGNGPNSRSELWRGAILVALLTVLAAMEVAGVASIAPFLAVMANPVSIETTHT
jgi:hypothetical protein